MDPRLPAERHVTLDCGQHRGPHARDSVQSSDVAERATGLPIGNNAFRQSRPDSRQPGHFFRARPVKIDTLPRAQAAALRAMVLSLWARGDCPGNAWTSSISPGA